MQPSETPDDRVAQIRARAEAAHAEVHRLCEGARWTMQVPARPERDSDLVISAALGDIGYLLDQLAEARRQLAEAVAQAVHLTINCRYHGDNIERVVFGKPGPCCDTGTEAWHNRKLLAALGVQQ